MDETLPGGYFLNFTRVSSFSDISIQSKKLVRVLAVTTELTGNMCS